jgi:lysophospholipase L1-like esterase
MNRHRRIVFLGAAIAAFAAFWYFGPGSPAAARPTAGTQVIAFGDSLVEGVGATPGHDFVSLLSSRVGVPIVNAGRRGETTGSALGRLDRDVLERNPRVVIVVLGGNDYLRRVPRQQTFENLERIVSSIRARGAAVIVGGIDPGLFWGSYDDDYEALAGRNSAGFVSDILDGILDRADRRHDPIHPNDAGYAVIADRFEPLLRELLN